LRATPGSAGQDFRCAACGDLLEFFFPGWTSDSPVSNPAALKALWLNRRTSREALDQSGVWRFRELLPHIPAEHAITLREGNTPLYSLPRCARALAWRIFSRSTRHEPDRIVQGHGMTFAASSAQQSGFRWWPALPPATLRLRWQRTPRAAICTAWY